MIRLALLLCALAASTALRAAPVFVAASEPVFGTPHDATLDASGRFLYVADLRNDLVRVLDARSLRVLGEIGRGQLVAPHDVVFDGDGRLLVADTGNNRVAVFEVAGSKGRYVGEIRGGMVSPEGVAVDPQGRVFVANAGTHDVARYEGGRLTKRVGRLGARSGEFSKPHDVDLGPDGLLYVADPGNNRVQVLTRELRPTGQIVGEGKPFDEPKYLAFDEHGRLYIADEYNNMIRILDAKHAQIAVIAEADGRPLNKPEGVVARGDLVWVVDSYNDRVLLYRWAH
jgi:DNA-binding beta-propeller fold protein YncE